MLDVLATGVDTTTPECMRLLCSNASQILLVGDDSIVSKFESLYPEFGYKHVNIGVDRWLMPQHPELVAKIIEQLQALGIPQNFPFYGSIENYQNALTAAWERHHIQQ